MQRRGTDFMITCHLEGVCGGGGGSGVDVGRRRGERGDDVGGSARVVESGDGQSSACTNNLWSSKAGQSHLRHTLLNQRVTQARCGN